LLVQVVLHAKVDPLHVYGKHDVGAVEHAPLEHAGAISESPRHAAVPQAPVASMHAPFPLQAPSHAS
jgi:hypothetical protein